MAAGGPPPQAVVEGPKGRTTPDGVGPSVTRFAAATSPSLRDREDWYDTRVLAFGQEGTDATAARTTVADRG